MKDYVEIWCEKGQVFKTNQKDAQRTFRINKVEDNDLYLEDSKGFKFTLTRREFKSLIVKRGIVKA